MMQIHEYRRATFFGSPVEQKTLKTQYKEECDFLQNLKSQKQQEDAARDRMHTQMCQDIFMQQVREQKMKEIQRREMQKKIAEDNLMIAEAKRKQAMEAQVREKMEMQQKINDMKVKPPTMVR